MFVVGIFSSEWGISQRRFQGDLWDVAVLRVLIEPVRGVCMFSYHCGIILVSM